MKGIQHVQWQYFLVLEKVKKYSKLIELHVRNFLSYYWYIKYILDCDVSCDSCDGPGPENCLKCAVAYYDVGGICRGKYLGNFKFTFPN